MSFVELFLIAVGLSMDAFAVAVCKGLAMKRINLKKSLIVGIYFGAFQALMPLIGYALGTTFEKQIKSVDHWVAFVLLLLIGGNMVKEALSKDEEEPNDSLAFRSMIVLAIATSIDALAIGITFVGFNVNIITAISLIGVTTLIISMVGVKIGNVFGTKYKSRAEFAGGLILILLGIKILLEHLNVIQL